jgi:hypothetical protein
VWYSFENRHEFFRVVGFPDKVHIDFQLLGHAFFGRKVFKAVPISGKNTPARPQIPSRLGRKTGGGRALYKPFQNIFVLNNRNTQNNTWQSSFVCFSSRIYGTIFLR